MYWYEVKYESRIIGRFETNAEARIFQPEGSQIIAIPSYLHLENTNFLLYFNFCSKEFAIHFKRATKFAFTGKCTLLKGKI